jgi:hypothetical protein
VWKLHSELGTKVIAEDEHDYNVGDVDMMDEMLEAIHKEVTEDHLILIVAPDGDWARNSSNGYPTIRRSETTDAQTPSAGLVQNLNLDFNAVRVQAIMETIQRVAPDGSPLALLAQQGAEAANLVVAEKSAGVPRGEPSAFHNDRAWCARSEAASSATPRRHLSEHDARRRIT